MAKEIATHMPCILAWPEVPEKVTCPRCSGLMILQKLYNFNQEADSALSYTCLICGHLIDEYVLSNKGFSPKQIRETFAVLFSKERRAVSA